MRKLFALVLALAMVLSAGICAQAESGGAVKVWVGKEEGTYGGYLYKMREDFTAKTGLTAEFYEITGDMHETLLQEIIANTGEIDVYDTDQPWIPEFATYGFYTPITKYVTEEQLADFYDSAVQSVTYNGEIYGLPYQMHGPLVFYRKDLMEKADQQVPTTNEAYRSVAKALTDTAAGIYGTAVEGKQSAEPVSQFTDLILQFGGKIVDEDWNILFDSQPVRDAFQYMLDIMADGSSPAAAVSWDNEDVHNMFLQGKLAMVRNWPYMYGMSRDASLSNVVDLVGATTQPVTSAVWSWSLGIPSTSKNPENAYKFIEWATSSDILAGYAEEQFQSTTRVSAVEKVLASDNLTDADKEVIRAMGNSLEIGTAVVTTPNYETLRTLMAECLSGIMSGQKTIDEAVTKCAEDMNAAMDELYSEMEELGLR